MTGKHQRTVWDINRKDPHKAYDPAGSEDKVYGSFTMSLFTVMIERGNKYIAPAVFMCADINARSKETLTEFNRFC